LVVPDQTNTQIGHAGSLITLDHLDHRRRWPQSHQSMIMHPAAVVLLQKCASESLGPLGIRIEADGGVDA
jgi:hypothetical protein